MAITYSSESKVSTSGILYGTRRKFNLGDKVAELTPSETPFLTMLSKLRKVKVNDADYNYLEHRAHWLDNVKYQIQTAGGFTASKMGATVTLYVANTNSPMTTIKSGHILQVLDADSTAGLYANVLVTSVSSATSASGVKVTAKLITDSPGFNSASSDYVQRIGSAFEENAAKANGYTDNLETHWASTQIFKTLYGISRTLRKTKLVGGNEYQRIRADKLREHKIDIERALIFGERNSSVSGNPFAAPGGGVQLGTNNVLRTTHGIISAIAYGASANGVGGTREFNITKSSYSYSDFIDDMEEVFEYGNPKKVAMCGMGVISFFNKMALAESQMTISSKDTKWGLKIMTIQAPAGELSLVWHPLLRGQYKDYMIIVDISNAELAVFDDTTLETNVQTPGTDGVEEQYLSDLGLVYKLPETGAIFRFY